MRARRIVRALAIAAAIGGVLWFQRRPPGKSSAGGSTNALVSARPYRLVTPTAVDPNKAYPLVLILHGWGGNTGRIARYYQLDTLVDERGFLIAYPEGTEETHRHHLWNRQRRFWNATDACCNFYGSTVDDVAYLDAVIDDVGAHHRVDAKRIFVMGLSNGGYMSHRYACDRANRVAAIVSQAGAMWGDTSRCKPSEPVAVLQIHGTDDEMVPFQGRNTGAHGQPRLPSAPESASAWAAFDHCDAASDTSAPARDLVAGAPDAETTTERWTGCRGVELWTMRGAPHVPDPHQPLFARTIYDWLAAHPKP